MAAADLRHLRQAALPGALGLRAGRGHADALARAVLAGVCGTVAGGAGLGDRRTTSDERRTTNDERRTTNDERRTTNDERRTTNDERRTTNDQNTGSTIAEPPSPLVLGYSPSCATHHVLPGD